MRRLAFSLIAALLTAGAAAAQASEEAAVRAALQHYFNGQATGDGEHFKRVFHPDSKLFWVKDGQVAQRASAEYIGGASGRPAADEAQRKRWVESVDVAGDIAFAKVILDYPSVRFTDYMSLAKAGGEWRIVNKTYHAAPKAKR